jgi:hypothetical protein
MCDNPLASLALGIERRDSELIGLGGSDGRRRGKGARKVDAKGVWGKGYEGSAKWFPHVDSAKKRGVM